MTERLRPCANPICERHVGGSAPHCCGPCVNAHEGRYEIHEHTAACDERRAARGCQCYYRQPWWQPHDHRPGCVDWRPERSTAAAIDETYRYDPGQK